MQPCRPFVEFHISITSPNDLNTQYHEVNHSPSSQSFYQQKQALSTAKTERKPQGPVQMYGKWVCQRKENVQILSADWEQINLTRLQWRGREDKDFMIREKSAVTHGVITRFGLKSNKDQSHIHEIVNVIVTSSRTYTAHHTLVHGYTHVPSH